MKTNENVVVSYIFYPCLLPLPEGTVFTEKGSKAVTPLRRLQAKGETSTLYAGKLCYNVINIIVLVLAGAELQEGSISRLSPHYNVFF